MKKRLYKLSFLLFFALGTLFVPRVLAYDNIEEIYSYSSLNYINNGTVEIVKNDLGNYDISFYDSDTVYIRKNVGLPVVYDDNKNYNLSYSVFDDDNGNKRSLMIFTDIDDSNKKISWDMTSGVYQANNVVTVTSSKIVKTNSDNILPSYRDFWVYFSTDVQMDEVYQIDINYTTYNNLFWTSWGYENHDKSIYRENLYEDNILYETLDIYFDVVDPYSIQPSDNNDFDYKALFHTSKNSYVYIKNLVFIKFYYVTSGEYYESDTVIDDGTSLDPPASGGTGEEFIENIKNTINFFTENKDRIILGLTITAIIWLITLLLPVAINLFMFGYMIIKLLFGIVVFILKIPILLLSSIFIKSSKKKLKYKYN